MSSLRHFSLLLLSLIVVLGGCRSEKPTFDSASQESSLQIGLEDGTTRRVGFLELLQQNDLSELTHHDFLFGEKRHYLGLNLSQLKRLAGADESYSVLKLHCRDGYRSEVELSVVEQGEFLLAVRDLQAEPAAFTDYADMTYLRTRPEELSKKLEDPNLAAPEREALSKERERMQTLNRDLKALGNQGPFYPVFHPAPSLPKDKRWSPPFCVDRVTFAKSPTDKTAALPEGLGEDHPAVRGARLFQNVCATCHSVNGVGGEVAPELNRPLSVTEYWDEAALRQMLKNPAKVREGSKMPAFHLADDKIDDILAYLTWMANNKKIQK